MHAVDRGIDELEEFNVGIVEIVRRALDEYGDACASRGRQENGDLVVDVGLPIDHVEIFVLVLVVTEDRLDGHDATLSELPPVIVKGIKPVIAREVEIHSFTRHDLVYEKIGRREPRVTHHQRKITPADPAENSRQVTIKAASPDFARQGS
jgi:hypothetical protein